VKGMLRFPEAVAQDPAIDVWLVRPAPELGAIARTWFRRMRRCGSDVRELMHDGCPTACVGDAPFGYVGVYRAHANVGFFYGAELPDPAGLLEGSGKRMRHVKVKPGKGLDSSALDALIDAAYADITQRLAASPVLDVARTIRAEVERASASLREWQEADVARPGAGGKWSRKEILGHLIDSAANNHQRIVRAQFSSPLVFPGYDQVAWVEANAYRTRGWGELVELWAVLNSHLAAAIESVPQAKLATPVAIGDHEPMPLEWWITDYLRHLRHHLEQIERR